MTVRLRRGDGSEEGRTRASVHGSFVEQARSTMAMPDYRALAEQAAAASAAAYERFRAAPDAATVVNDEPEAPALDDAALAADAAAAVAHDRFHAAPDAPAAANEGRAASESDVEELDGQMVATESSGHGPIRLRTAMPAAAAAKGA